MARHIPSVASRRLTSELRRLRENSDRKLTNEQAAEELGWSPSKVYRIENDRSGVIPRDVRRMARLYGVEEDSEQWQALLTLARQAREKRGWWHQYDDVLPQGFEMYAALEADAAALRTYQSELVEGLLQTGDYARALLRAAPRPEAEEETERQIAAQMARQERLTGENPLGCWAVLNEAVLRRTVGGREVMRRQLDHLRESAELAHVTLQVLPFEAGAHPGMHGAFEMLSFPDQRDADVAYTQHRTGSQYVENAAAIETYRLVFDHLRALALGPDESAELIHRVAKEL